jgi:hypothetical protein
LVLLAQGLQVPALQAQAQQDLALQALETCLADLVTQATELH